MGWASERNPQTHADVVRQVVVEEVVLPDRSRTWRMKGDISLLRQFVEQVVQDNDSYQILYSEPQLVLIESRIEKPGNGKAPGDDQCA